MPQKIIIATRKSPLALWQAEHVRTILKKHYPMLSCELLKIVTKGDKFLQEPLTAIGGKGLFLKELEEALLCGEADIAVHSMKDVPHDLSSDFTIAAILKREDPRDVLVSNLYDDFFALPKNAVIGTASVRRMSQLKYLRPDLNFHVIRGNVGTRLQKLDNKEYDALILAASGLLRLDLKSRIKEYLDFELCLPATAQGAIGIEVLSTNKKAKHLIKKITHRDTELCVGAERALNRVLGGSCKTPIGCYASLSNNIINITALVASTGGKKIIKAKSSGNKNNPEDIGQSLGNNLIKLGAKELIM